MKSPVRQRRSTRESRGQSRTLRRRAVLAVPNGMTFANLFFGVFAIVTAVRGDFYHAGLYILFSGIADVLDGRIARATDTGTRVGAELDSLVDVISFGLAPALIMYFAVLNKDGGDWMWIWAFVYIACAAWRLAVFNVEQAGRAKKYFHGLPSPAAGITLASYYWFSQTSLYTQTNISDLPWHQMLRFVMGGLAMLMISPIPYPAFPTVGFKNRREILSLLLVVVVIAGMFMVPKEFLFPACLIYVVYGLLKTVLFGFFNRRTENDPTSLVLEEDDDSLASGEAVVSLASAPRLAVSADSMPPAPSSVSGAGAAKRRRRRRPPRGNGNSNRPDRPGPDTPSSPPGE